MTSVVVTDPAFGDEYPSHPVAELPARLVEELTRLEKVIVAFSGGADSAFLTWAAVAVLGPENVVCTTAVSPSLAPEELVDCRELASEMGVELREISTSELANPAYSANNGDRCFYCKAELMSVLQPVASELGSKIILGVNVDDLGDHRPGQQAATEGGAVFPFVDAGLTKSEIRAISKTVGLRTWDKPAAACLASRVPYGTPVTIGTLSKVASSESKLKKLGFRQLRVRYYEDTARIELADEEIAKAVELRTQIVEALKSSGYKYVTLDLAGFRSGNLNDALKDSETPGASGSKQETYR